MTARSPDTPAPYPGYVSLALGWTFVGTLAWARHYVQDAPEGRWTELAAEWLLWLTCFHPWILLCPIVFRLEQRFPVDRGRWPKHLPVLAAAALPLSALAFGMMWIASSSMQHLLPSPFAVPRPWLVINPLRELLIQSTFYGAAILAAVAIRRLGELSAHERLAAALALERSQLESSLRRAELDVLRMRLNPHFLFNSLQSISVLAQQDPKTASRMLAKLGDLLRAAFRRDAQAETTLDAELALTRAYLDVERMRFGDRLSVLIGVDPDTATALVPTLLLQPLVENAIKHGLRGAPGGGVIALESRCDGNTLVLTIADNGTGVPAQPLAGHDTGVGLQSTTERLERMYPRQHTFAIERLARGGTEVRITLPLRRAGSPS